MRDKQAAKMTNKEIESWINDTLEVQLNESKLGKHFAEFELADLHHFLAVYSPRRTESNVQEA